MCSVTLSVPALCTGWINCILFCVPFFPPFPYLTVTLGRTVKLSFSCNVSPCRYSLTLFLSSVLQPDEEVRLWSWNIRSFTTCSGVTKSTTGQRRVFTVAILPLAWAINSFLFFFLVRCSSLSPWCRKFVEPLVTCIIQPFTAQHKTFRQEGGCVFVAGGSYRVHLYTVFSKSTN